MQNRSNAVQILFGSNIGWRLKIDAKLKSNIISLGSRPKYLCWTAKVTA